VRPIEPQTTPLRSRNRAGPANDSAACASLFGKVLVDPRSHVEFDQRAGQPFVYRFDQLRFERRALLVQPQGVADHLAGRIEFSTFRLGTGVVRLAFAEGNRSVLLGQVTSKPNIGNVVDIKRLPLPPRKSALPRPYRHPRHGDNPGNPAPRGSAGAALSRSASCARIRIPGRS
jgi:hypothetical protein